MGAPQKLTMVPWFTVAYAAGAMAVFALPGAEAMLEYDRSGLARGELWRLFTAHLVHYSGSHLLSNLGVLLPGLWLLEARDRRGLPALLAATVLAVGAELWIVDPGIERYAGGSSLAFGLLMLVGLRGLSRGGRWRSVCAVLLGIVVVKLAAECLFGWRVTDWQRHAGFVTVPFSHAAGAVAGLVAWWWRERSTRLSDVLPEAPVRGRERRRESPSPPPDIHLRQPEPFTTSAPRKGGASMRVAFARIGRPHELVCRLPRALAGALRSSRAPASRQSSWPLAWRGMHDLPRNAPRHHSAD